MQKKLILEIICILSVRVKSKAQGQHVFYVTPERNTQSSSYPEGINA